jgi:hypothetical protein
MTLDEIFEEWSKDSQLDKAEIGNAALEIAKLHNKYYQFLSRERLLLKKMESQTKELKLEKYEFYTDGPTQEQIEKGWKLPAKGKILKAQINDYLDADSEIIKANLKLSYQSEKVETLNSILKTISTMGFHIKSYIDWERFKVGGL